MFKKKKDQTYQSYWSISWNIFKKNKVAMVSFHKLSQQLLGIRWVFVPDILVEK